MLNLQIKFFKYFFIWKCSKQLIFEDYLTLFSEWWYLFNVSNENKNYIFLISISIDFWPPTRLDTKGKYYEEQADYYERYITDCLAKQTAVKEGKRKRSLRTSFRSKSTSTSVKYSAEELKKKKILISITENIDNWKRLQVVFRISSNYQIIR